MARLRNASPGNPSGAYVRLFDDEALGELASKIQSAVISSGSELERIIRKKAPNIPDLDAVLEQSIVPDGVRLAHKRQIQRSRILNLAGSEPDFMVFERHGGTQTCHIIELKDGHVFDTKKVDAERRSMHDFITRNARYIPCPVRAHFCAFNQDDKQEIWNGFKKRIDLEEAMTGREFCDLLKIDHDAIVEARRADGPDNVTFLLTELVKIDFVRRRLIDLLDENGMSAPREEFERACP